jgi:PAS domain S-box-containing protein
MNASSAVAAVHHAAVIDALAGPGFDSVMITEAAAKSPIVYVNAAFTELTGYTADEVLGQSPRLLQGPDTDAAVLERLTADMAASRVFEGKATNYRKDGTPFTMWWRVVPVMGSAGTPAFYVAFQRTVQPA